jgi:predicted metallopeptidase
MAERVKSSTLLCSHIPFDKEGGLRTQNRMFQERPAELYSELESKEI